jgi:sterol desaturase/sphingolipid hydroxylase (fatty acid hydroxylase superfamily)
MHDTLMHLAQRLMEFFTGPVTGLHTRYYWIFLLQAAILAFVVHLLQGGRLATLPQRFPLAALFHRSSLVDWQINIANAVVGPALKLFWRLSAPTVVAATMLHQADSIIGPAPHLLHANMPTLAALTLLALIGDDFGYYVFHRLAHQIPWLWSFHKLHHSAEVLTPLVAGRVHPLEETLSEPFRAIFGAAAMAPLLFVMDGDAHILTVGGISVTALLFGALGNQLLHAEIPISFGDRLHHVLVSPALHQIHHSALACHHNRNLGGLLSVWDWCFGTLHLPQPGERIVFGLQEEAAQIHPTLAAAYFRPFGEIWRGVAGLVARRVRQGTVAGDVPSPPDAPSFMMARTN